MNILDRSFLDIIRSDFSALWNCKEHRDSLEISTPYLYPWSAFVRVFLTQRENRYIVTEDGDVGEWLSEYLPGEDLSIMLDQFAASDGIKRGTHDDRTIYFKDSTDPKLITSLIFDVANFASRAANVIFANSASQPA